MSFGTILKKDLIIEIRSKETLISMLSLAIMISVLAALGVQSAFIEPKALVRMFPTLLWIGFIFAGTISISRSLHYEFAFRGIDALLTIGISPAMIYVSKTIVNTVVTTLMFAVLAVLLSGLLGIAFYGSFGAFMLIGLLCSIGYASLSTLCSAMTIHAKLKELLLPLILLPLLFPIFFAGHELCAQILSGGFDLSSPWVTLLLVLDLIYVVVGINLFEYAVRG